jgi:hypothetical protein
MSARKHEIRVRLSADELVGLDERRPNGLTRAQWLRELARGPVEAGESPSRRQVIAALWRMTQDGKVQPAVALERALRPRTALRNEPPDTDYDELERIIEYGVEAAEPSAINRLRSRPAPRVLEMLTKKAREGSTRAAAVLEEALRVDPPGVDPDDEFERIMEHGLEAD